MLSLAPGTRYVHEPFNPQANPFDYHLVPPPFEDHFHFILDHEKAAMRQHLEHRLGLFYPWRVDLRKRPDLKRAIGATKRWMGYRATHFQRYRPLLKDPLALMSLDWLIEELNPDIVISVRHPAAFVSSIKRLNWDVGPHLFLSQPELCANLLSSLVDDLRALDRKADRDLIDEAVLAWRVFHHVILNHAARHPDTILVRTEDLSRNAVEEYRKLFARLSLAFSDRVRSEIAAHSSEDNLKEAGTGRANQIKRDSVATISVWKTRLSSHEIERIRSATEDISSQFYGDADW